LSAFEYKNLQGTVATRLVRSLITSLQTYAWFPPFRCRSSVAVSPFPLAVAVSVHRFYGCNGTEFSYVIFTEHRNFTTAERRNGNGRTATERLKPGITAECFGKRIDQYLIKL